MTARKIRSTVPIFVIARSSHDSQEQLPGFLHSGIDVDQRAEAAVDGHYHGTHKEEDVMTEAALKTSDEAAKKAAPPVEWRPFEGLRRDVDQLLENFGLRPWRASPSLMDVDFKPFWGSDTNWGGMPAVDMVDNGNAYVVTAELPGMSETDIDVKYADQTLTIRGEKKEEKEEKKQNRYLSERRYGAFQRVFRVPNGIDADKIEAEFNNGVLTVTLPKTPEAMKSEKKIAIKKA
jgi:HSP20 family protein